MTTGFREVVFSTKISAGAGGGPQGNTNVIQGGTPNEQRTPLWADPLWEWDLSSAILTREDWEYVLNFYIAVAQMRAYGFLWKDRSCFKNVDSQNPAPPLLGTGTTSNYEFQLIKRFGVEGYTYDMDILKPAEETTRVYLVNEGAAFSGATRIFPDDSTYPFTLDQTTGVITFTGGASAFSGGNKDVYVYTEFYFPVRFDSDIIKSDWIDFNKHRYSIPIVSLKL